MTLLSIAQNAVSYAGLSAPDSIVGNSDQTSLLVLAAARQAGESVARRPQGGWVDMIREFDFVTMATAVYSGTVDNTGPGGTAVITIFSDTNVDELDLVIAPNYVAKGTFLPNNAVVVDSTQTLPSFTYVITLNVAATSTGDGSFSFGRANYALPADFQRPIDNTFWDRTRFWSMRGPLSPQQWQLFKSSAIGYASIQRRFRFRGANVINGAGGTPGTAMLSIDPVPFDNGSALVFEYVSNAWCKSASGTLQTTWAADTDVGILDEYLIQLDVIWRVLRRLGLSYSDEQAEAMSEIDKAMATDGGAPILSLTPNTTLSLIGPWNLPETGFGGSGDSFTIGVSDIGGPAGIG
jgi:hypothetical protein